MADYEMGVGLFNDMDAWKEDLKDIAILGASAAGAVIVFNAASKFAAQKVPAVAPYLTGRNKSIAAVVVGAGAGVLLGQTIGKHGGMGRGIAAGVATGLVGWGAAQLANEALNLAGFNLGETDDLLLGVDVEDYRPLPGQINGVRDIEAQPGLASWLS